MSMIKTWKKQLLSLMVEKQSKTHMKPIYSCSKGQDNTVKISKTVFEDRYPLACKLYEAKFIVCICLWLTFLIRVFLGAYNRILHSN